MIEFTMYETPAYVVLAIGSTLLIIIIVSFIIGKVVK